MSEFQHIIIKGKCKWAKLQTPVKNFSGEGTQYEIEVEVTDSALEDLRKRGMSKRKETKDYDGVKYLKLIKPTKSKSGADLKPPIVIGRNCTPFTDLIGNGSEVAVKVLLIPYDSPKFGKGVSLRLSGVQVIDHVKYSGGTNSELSGFEMLDSDDNSDPLSSMVSDEDI